jgi:hypothetical protein
MLPGLRPYQKITFNQVVVGSIPTGLTTPKGLAQNDRIPVHHGLSSHMRSATQSVRLALFSFGSCSMDPLQADRNRTAIVGSLAGRLFRRSPVAGVGTIAPKSFLMPRRQATCARPVCALRFC